MSRHHQLIMNRLPKVGKVLSLDKFELFYSQIIKHKQQYHVVWFCIDWVRTGFGLWLMGKLGHAWDVKR